MSAVIRSMTAADIEPARRVQVAAFDPTGPGADGLPPDTVARQRGRFEHFLQHDPAGSWVAEDDGRVVGAALALRRGDLWGLSLLVVDPVGQSNGVGSALLAASLSYADGAPRAVILSTEDPRAMRAYARAGFDLHPQVGARGRVDADRLPAAGRAVRDGDPADAQLADRVDSAVRGAPRGPDHVRMAQTFRMFVVDDTAGCGYAYLRRDGEMVSIAATDEDAATALLARCLRETADNGQEAVVDHIAGNQQWAVRTVVSAGLALRPGGPVFWRGGTPPQSYLPSGAYL